MSGGARLPKRSRADDSSSMEVRLRCQCMLCCCCSAPEGLSLGHIAWQFRCLSSGWLASHCGGTLHMERASTCVLQQACCTTHILQSLFVLVPFLYATIALHILGTCLTQGRCGSHAPLLTCLQEDDDEQEDEPHMASRSCAHPAASDGGIHSCADSKAAAACRPSGSRRVSTPTPEDGWCTQQQQAGGNLAMSPAVSSASAYSDGAAPSPLNLGPAAAPNSTGGSSRNRTSTSGNSSGRGGQQAGQLRGVVRGPNGRFMSRHGMSPLSVASSGSGASKPSRFGAAAKISSVTASRLQPQPAAPSAGATGPVVPGSGARMPGGESRQPTAAAAGAPTADAATAGVPAVSPVVQLLMDLAGNLGSTQAAVEFINQQVNSKSGAGGLNAAAAAIAAVAAGGSVTSDLASSAAAGIGGACARPASAGQVGV
jgi:hypothetical protein